MIEIKAVKSAISATIYIFEMLLHANAQNANSAVLRISFSLVIKNARMEREQAISANTSIQTWNVNMENTAANPTKKNFQI